MRTEEEVEAKNEEAKELMSDTHGADYDALVIHRVLDWVLELSDELEI